MKKLFHFLLLLFIAVACSSDDDNYNGVTPEIVFTPDTQKEQIIYADETDSAHGIAFKTNTMWRVDITGITSRNVENTAGWLRVDQYGGGRGEFNLKIVSDINETGVDRIAEIVITCGDKYKFIVIQKGVKRDQMS